MGRTAIAVVAVAVVLGGVAGCGGDPNPKFSKSASSSPNASTSSAAAPSSVDPSPPEMPNAAKAHTPAGAKAFVRFYWVVANYAQRSLDWPRLASLSDDNCAGCRGAVKFVKRVAAREGVVRGGVTTIDRLKVTRIGVADQIWMSVAYDWHATPQVIHFSGAKKDESYPGGGGRDRLTLKPVPGGWRIDLMELLK